METKKNNFIERLRLKPKLPKLKKLPKKPLAKQKRNMGTRRSISVPDLTCEPGESSFSESSDFTASGISLGPSDTDSIGSLNTDVQFFTDRLSDRVPETKLRLSPNPALNGPSAPGQTQIVYEEISDLRNPSLASTQNLEDMYAKVDKKGGSSKITFAPIPTPKHVYETAQDLSSIPDLPERRRLLSEDPSAVRGRSDSAAAALPRAHSHWEQMNPYREKMISFEQKPTSSEKGTPPAIRQNAPTGRVTTDTANNLLESGDGNSADSAGDTPSEEKVNMPWTTNADQQKRHCYTKLMPEFSMDEGLLEETQGEEEEDEDEDEEEEEEEEAGEVSIIFIIMYLEDPCWKRIQFPVLTSESLEK